MATVAALLESRPALLALRRTLPKEGSRVASCRSLAALQRTLVGSLIDAVVLSPKPPLLSEIAELRQAFPAIPFVAFAAFRPDDGELVLSCHRQQMAAVAVEGVDDAVVGDIVRRHSAAAARREALADAPRVLRLTERLQLQVWDLLLGQVDQPLRTETIARQLKVSREHLSRQFGAGGAPNLKRVIDLTRVACAAQLLRNPGYSVLTVVKLLRFASPSHLRGTARRITNTSVDQLGSLGPRGVLAAFVKGNTRSRAVGAER